MPKDQHVEAIIKEIESTGVHMRVYFLDAKTNDTWEAKEGGRKRAWQNDTGGCEHRI
jgi:hypothetical protein